MKKNEQIIKVKVNQAELLITEIFKKKSCHTNEAETISKRLCLSNLKGHDSHGMVRVPRYCEWIDEKRVYPNKDHKIILDSGPLAIIDANQGFGQVMGEKSVVEGVKRAKKHGISLIGLKNSGHLGRIGDWSELAADKGMVSLHFVNVRGSLLVAPFGGSDRRGSTSPLSIGVPVKGEKHIILDMATSTVAEGKALVAQKGGKKLPIGALVDQFGNLTNDTEALYGKIGPDDVPNPDKGSGAITAFGMHKGSGINFMMEILGGALTSNDVCGVNHSEIRPFANGMLSIFIDVEKFVDIEYFAEEVKSYSNFVRSSPPAKGVDNVLIPGDNEQIIFEDRSKNGIPIAREAWDLIKNTAKKINVSEINRFEEAIIN
jgi:uncharacterized oxidoreductase